MNVTCLKHSDPRDTSVMRPQDAPCSCEPVSFVPNGERITCNHGPSCCWVSVVTQAVFNEAEREHSKGCGPTCTARESDYTFMDHLRVFYPAEYKRRIREASK